MDKLSQDAFEQFAGELASYVKAGLPVPQALRELEGRLRSGDLKRLCAQVADGLEKGQPLSQALASADTKLPPEFISLVRCGEMSGEMEPVLRFAVQQSRRDKRHRDALFTTVIYPAFVLIAFFLTFYLISSIIVPRLVDVYQQLGAELPRYTRWLIAIATPLMGPAGLPVTLALVTLILAALYVPAFRERAYLVVSSFPGFRNLVALTDMATAMQVVAFNLPRGVTLQDTLSAASWAVGRPESRDALLRMSQAAEQGNSVAEYLPPDCPATAAWIFAEAERRGDIAPAATDIADYCEDRFDRLSKRAIAFLEPMLIFFIAAWIAMVLIGLYLPLFGIPKLVGAN